MSQPRREIAYAESLGKPVRYLSRRRLGSSYECDPRWKACLRRSGTADDWVSMAVVSDGSYGVPEGLISSFPVTTKDGNWEIV